MTLAIQAYGPESRGTVLGVIAATIGLGAAIGPLLGGALSESLGWQSLFAINTVAAVTVPIGLKILPKDEERSGGSLDLFGGVALGFLVGGVLLIPSEGARSGWSSSLVLTGAVMAFIGLVGLSARHVDIVHPQVAVPGIWDKFDEGGQLVDEPTREEIRDLLGALSATASGTWITSCMQRRRQTAV